MDSNELKIALNTNAKNHTAMKRLTTLAGLCLLSGMSLWAQSDKEVILPQKPHRATYVDHTQSETGFWCSAEVEGGSTVMLNHVNMQAAQLTYTGGYRFNEYLKVGAGFGVKYYINNNSHRRGKANSCTFPLYVNVRGNFLSQAERSMVPYWSVSVGNVFKDGFFFSPSVGLRFGEQRNSWLVGLSYSLNHINTDRLEVPPATRLETTSSLMLHVGYEF